MEGTGTTKEHVTETRISSLNETSYLSRNRLHLHCLNLSRTHGPEYRIR